MMGLTAILQISSLLWIVKRELKLRAEQKLRDLVADSFSVPPPENLTFEWAMYNMQFWFILPILISISVLVVYILLIWYRDWLGRSTFIYRLLMLPSARCQLYWAKITAILLFVFVMISYQLALLSVEHFIFNLAVPADSREESHIVDAIKANPALNTLIPRRFEQFLYSYGLGTLAVLVIFTTLLFERSYRRVGILYGLLYLAGCSLVVFLAISTTTSGLRGYLYPGELFVIIIAVCIAVAIASIWLGLRLIKRKISV
ncbi:hypothetical protein KP806_04440 [Paenibacillus sp. N4]|uniref:hypothetical protein n=1 Tax=Paenibacillus vietnamensis TaxID=2590547 RepID=UPI001CD07AC7|nr:hypothetical protein [Paenibacillus vietnamensis]MCA0754285.1 hypothetical protein [Paenibacillus vietnamensis]